MYENVPDKMTLGDAKEIMRRRFRDKERFKCPCCNNWVGKRRRSIAGRHYAELIRLHLATERGAYLHKRDFAMSNTGGGDFAKLRYWNLIETKPTGPGADKTHSGLWRITDRGRAFVEQRLRLPKYAWDYNENFYEFEGPDASIRDCLGQEFSFSSLHPKFKPHADRYHDTGPGPDPDPDPDNGNLWDEPGRNWHPDPG